MTASNASKSILNRSGDFHGKTACCEAPPDQAAQLRLLSMCDEVGCDEAWSAVKQAGRNLSQVLDDEGDLLAFEQRPDRFEAF